MGAQLKERKKENARRLTPSHVQPSKPQEIWRPDTFLRENTPPPPPPHTHTKKREENLFFSIPHSSLNGPRRGKLRNKEDEGEVCNYNGTIRISTPLPPYTHAQKKRMNAVTLKNRLSSFTKRTEPSRKRVWLRM